MGAYLLRRLLLVVPTLLGIIIINFGVVQFAPGGPVEQMIAELRGQGQTLGRITGEGGGEVRTRNAAEARGTAGGGQGPVGSYRGAQGLDPTIVAERVTTPTRVRGQQRRNQFPLRVIQQPKPRTRCHPVSISSNPPQVWETRPSGC